jgi:cytoskeletal protein CcmA (bactofilin family)
MFSNKVKDTVSALPPLSAVPAAPPPKRMVRTDCAPSIISGDVTVKGTLESCGDMQIDGRVEGDIRSAGLVIGEKAEIRGEIYAEDLTVRGQVIGRIRARKVQLCATCRVEGDILHEAFAVEAGAFFEGNIRHSDNPLGEEMSERTRKPAPQPVAKPQPVAVAQPVASADPPPAVTPPPAVVAARMSPVATLAPLGSAN